MVPKLDSPEHAEGSKDEIGMMKSEGFNDRRELIRLPELAEGEINDDYTYSSVFSMIVTR